MNIYYRKLVKKNWIQSSDFSQIEFRRSQWIIDHRLIINRQKLFTGNHGERIKSGAGTSSKNDTFHSVDTPLYMLISNVLFRYTYHIYIIRYAPRSHSILIFQKIIQKFRKPFSCSKKLLVFSCPLEYCTIMLTIQGEGFDAYEWKACRSIF